MMRFIESRGLLLELRRGAARRTLPAIAWLVLCWLSVRPGIRAADWYVDNEAPGVETGLNWENAWRGFEQITWDKILPGDTVFISGGRQSKVYKEILRIKTDGGPEAPITIRPGLEPEHRGQVIIDGEGILTRCVELRSYITLMGDPDAGSYLRVCRATQRCILGERINGVVLKYLDVADSLGDGIYFNWPSLRTTITHCLLRNNRVDGYRAASSAPSLYRTRVVDCVITNNYDDGIAVDSGHEISRCYIANNYGGTSSDGIEANGYDNLMYNNVIVDVAGCAIIDKINPTYSRPTNVVIANNVIYQTRQNANFSMRGPFLSSSDSARVANLLVANNTVVDLTYLGMAVSVGEASEVHVVNNLIHNCSKSSVNYCVRIGSTGGTVLFDFNSISKGVDGLDTIQFNGEVYTQQRLATLYLGQVSGSSVAPTFLQYRMLANTKVGLYPLSRASFGIDLTPWVALSGVDALLTDLDGTRMRRPGGWGVGALAQVGNRLEFERLPDTGRVRVRGFVTNGAPYSLDASGDLITWNPLHQGQSKDPQVLLVEEKLLPETVSRFYRLVP